MKTAGDASTGKMTAADRKEMSVKLRLAGATYGAIGEQLGITRQRVAQILKKAMEDSAKRADAGADCLRELELQRCDKLQMRIWTAATAGDIPSIQAVLRIMERRAKLAGLDMPTKTDGRLQISENPYDGITETEAARILNEILAEAAETTGGIIIEGEVTKITR